MFVLTSGHTTCFRRIPAVIIGSLGVTGLGKTLVQFRKWYNKKARQRGLTSITVSRHRQPSRRRRRYTASRPRPQPAFSNSQNQQQSKQEPRAHSHAKSNSETSSLSNPSTEASNSLHSEKHLAMLHTLYYKHLGLDKQQQNVKYATSNSNNKNNNNVLGNEASTVVGNIKNRKSPRLKRYRSRANSSKRTRADKRKNKKRPLESSTPTPKKQSANENMLKTSSVLLTPGRNTRSKHRRVTLQTEPTAVHYIESKGKRKLSKIKKRKHKRQKYQQPNSVTQLLQVTLASYNNILLEEDAPVEDIQKYVYVGSKLYDVLAMSLDGEGNDLTNEELQPLLEEARERYDSLPVHRLTNQEDWELYKKLGETLQILQKATKYTTGDDDEEYLNSNQAHTPCILYHSENTIDTQVSPDTIYEEALPTTTSDIASSSWLKALDKILSWHRASYPFVSEDTISSNALNDNGTLKETEPSQKYSAQALFDNEASTSSNASGRIQNYQCSQYPLDTNNMLSMPSDHSRESSHNTTDDNNVSSENHRQLPVASPSTSY